MKSILAFAALAASLISGAAVAGPTTQLKVVGTIKPPACAPSFSAGGVIDYGTIPSGSLTAGQYKTLPSKTVTFSISCDAMVKTALKVTDNRTASAVPEATGYGTNFTYGLGSVAGKNVGGYTINMEASSVSVDGASAGLMFSTDGNQTWTATNGAGTFGKDRSWSWGSSGTSTPGAYKNIVGTVNVVAYLNKPENLPLSQDIPLDGSATFEVVYL